jgi:hypothetical protein
VVAGCLGLAGTATAQHAPPTLSGVWAAELHVDSAHAALHGAGAQHRVFRFDPGPYCGGPAIAYVTASGGSDTTHVSFTVAGDTLEFGGRVERLPSGDGAAAERCRISGDDGSLFGRGVIRAESVVGRWGEATFGSAGPIGTFVLRRR